jgi:hypothetical protein
MSPARAFILAQALAPEAFWGTGRRRVGQVEGAGRKRGRRRVRGEGHKKPETCGKMGRYLGDGYSPGQRQRDLATWRPQRLVPPVTLSPVGFWRVLFTGKNRKQRYTSLFDGRSCLWFMLAKSKVTEDWQP